MFGKKMDLRKKALEAMDSGGEMEIQIKKKSMPEMPSEDGMDGMDAAEGYEQMMISPEEKAMIMKMRAEKKGGLGVQIEMGSQGDEVMKETEGY